MFINVFFYTSHKHVKTEIDFIDVRAECYVLFIERQRQLRARGCFYSATCYNFGQFFSRQYLNKTRVTKHCSTMYAQY